MLMNILPNKLIQRTFKPVDFYAFRFAPLLHKTRTALSAAELNVIRHEGNHYANAGRREKTISMESSAIPD